MEKEKEQSLFNICDIVESKVAELMEAFPFMGVVLDKEETPIPAVICNVCEVAPLRFFIYGGYYIRKTESALHKEIKRNKIIDSQINKLINSKKLINSGDEIEDLLEKIANYLDESKVRGFGPNIKPFLFLPKNELNFIFEETLNRFLKNEMFDALYRHNKEAEEVVVRNMFFGYCLRVAFELILSTKRDIIQAIAKNPEKYGYISD